MSLYTDYLQEIKERETQGLNPKPIDDGALIAEIVEQIKDPTSEYKKDSLIFFTYNTLPGTTSAAVVKANFLKEIILEESIVEEISVESAFEQLSHMKGGQSIDVLLDLAFGDQKETIKSAVEVL